MKISPKIRTRKTLQTPIETKAQDPKGSVEDKVDLGKLDALREQPEIRPEVVAKGKELLDNPNYPSQEIVESIAKLIVPFEDED